jgi:hypothetical protein
MTILLVILLVIVLLVFKKYSIDTRATIKELKDDVQKYKSLAWKDYIGKNQAPKFNWLYLNLKEQMSALIKDLEDTDFNNYSSDIKQDILNALKNIDSYATTVAQEESDSLKHYRENNG